MGWLIGIGVVIALTIAWVVVASRYYGRMFAEEHFAQFHTLFGRAVKAARARGHTESGPNPEDGTAFVTDAGLIAGVDLGRDEDGRPGLLLSLSQHGRPTTDALCSAFAYFTVAMLDEDALEISSFALPSGVRFLDIRLPSTEFDLADFETSYAGYRASVGSGHAIPFPPAH